MVVFTPLSGALALGGADAILGGIGALTGSAAARQDYANQRAFQGANARFAQWQAGFNARFADANARHNYWQETINFNQNLAYSRSLRNYETLRSIEQARVVGETRAAAGASFVRDSEASSQAAAEMDARDAMAYHQFQVAALQARGRVMASGQEGGSVDRLIGDFARQAGDFATIAEINRRFRDRQYTREQAAQVADWLSRYNSQQFYQEQPYMEPLAPFMPLPALLEAPPPTMTGAPPSSAAGMLRFGSSLMGSAATGLGVYGQLRGVIR